MQPGTRAAQQVEPSSVSRVLLTNTSPRPKRRYNRASAQPIAARDSRQRRRDGLKRAFGRELEARRPIGDIPPKAGEAVTRPLGNSFHGGSIRTEGFAKRKRRMANAIRPRRAPRGRGVEASVSYTVVSGPRLRPHPTTRDHSDPMASVTTQASFRASDSERDGTREQVAAQLLKRGPDGSAGLPSGFPRHGLCPRYAHDIALTAVLERDEARETYAARSSDADSLR